MLRRSLTELEAESEHDESTNDEEPSLGSGATGENSSQARWADGSPMWFGEAEHEHDGAEPDEADREPSLGWTIDGFVAAEGCFNELTDSELDETTEQVLQ